MKILQAQPTTNADRHAGIAGPWILSLTSENSRKAYRRDLQDYFTFLDSHGFDALSAERKHVDLWQDSLREERSPSTIARKLSALSSFYNYAVQDAEVITMNPVQRVKRPHVDADHSSTQGITKEQALALLDEARRDSPRSYAYVSLLLLTGIRSSEALYARLSDLQHDSGHRVLVVTRKGGKRQKIVLPAQVVDALATYLGTSAAEGTEVVFKDAASADPHIFTTESGKGWASSEAYRTVRRLAGSAGIAGKISPHSMRHSHATIALDAGVSLRDLQDSLGHADPRTTRRYDRARGRLERSSAHTVAQILS